MTKAIKNQATQFRIASLSWLATEWFSHKTGDNIEILDLQGSDIRHSVDPYSSRQWEIQSSVNGGKTWQTQRRIQ